MNIESNFVLMEHNVEPYKELNEKFKIVDRCALVAATGTGKSYIAAMYAKKNGMEEHTLILVPKCSIINTWSNLLPKATCVTYQSLLIREYDFRRFKLVICDEMHHLGAELWGKAVKKTIGGVNCKILGLTATPIRYLDKSRDMTAEFFENNLIRGVQLSSAIESKILPSFEYVTALYSIPNWKRNQKTDEIKKLYSKLDLIKNKYSFKNILRKHLKEKRPYKYIKAIVFVDNIESITSIKNLCEEEFPSANHLIAHSKISDMHNMKTFSDFENSKQDSFLYVVDMLNEGRHFSNVNVEIMFRKTNSPIIYLQQIGRILDSASNYKKVMIFDFVANHMNLKNHQSLKYGTITCLNNEIKDSDRQIIEHDYALEELELIKKIKDLEQCIWTKEELDILRKFLSLSKEKRCTLKTLSHKLPKHTENSIQTKCRDLCQSEGYEPVGCPGIPKWTESDIKKLLEWLRNETICHTWKEVCDMFPYRTEGAVIRKVKLICKNNHLLNPISKRRGKSMDITEKDLEVCKEWLLEPWKNKTYYDLYKKLYPRSPVSVDSICTKLIKEENLPGMANDRIKWTAEDMKILGCYVKGDISMYEACSKMPYRSAHSIRDKARKVK